MEVSAEHVTPESDANTVVSVEAPRPLAIAPADVNEVMREQLEYLIEHAGGGTCGCPQCQRYLRARSLLMEIFGE